MQLSAVHLARIIFFLEVVDLNPRGVAYYPEITAKLVERLGFQQFPTKPEEFDEAKGVTFEQGRFSEITVGKLVIYQNGLQLDTTSDTQDSEGILRTILEWGVETLGLTFKPEMIRRKAYVSQFSFYSDAPLLRTNALLNTMAGEISGEVSSNLRRKYNFEPVGILIGPDPDDFGIPVSPFSIERRAQTPFSENKYFSAAPLPSKKHFDLVKLYENSLSK